MKNNYCTIYLVRHGETEHNVKGIIQGQSNSNLTEEGKQKIKERAEDFKHIHFDAVYSSDLIRAKDTADILVAGRQLIVNTHHLLRERRFGKYEGRPAKEYREENIELFEKMKTMSEQEKRLVKFDEVYENEEELGQRLLLYLRELAVTYAGKTLLVVSHGGAMRALLMKLGFVNFDESSGRLVDNVAHIKLESDGVDFFIKETFGINKKTS